MCIAYALQWIDLFVGSLIIVQNEILLLFFPFFTIMIFSV